MLEKDTYPLHSPTDPMQPPRHPAFARRHSGFTFTEIVAAMALIAILSASLIGALLSSQRFAAASRVMTNARVVVQRNIDTALGIRFTSANTPEILKVTDGEWVPFGDYQEDADTLIAADTPVPVHIDRHGDTIVEGTLSRNVRIFPSPLTDLVVHEVSIRIEYEFQGQPYSFSMTTLRSRDNQ